MNISTIRLLSILAHKNVINLEIMEFVRRLLDFIICVYWMSRPQSVPSFPHLVHHFNCNTPISVIVSLENWHRNYVETNWISKQRPWTSLFVLSNLLILWCFFPRSLSLSHFFSCFYLVALMRFFPYMIICRCFVCAHIIQLCFMCCRLIGIVLYLFIPSFVRCTFGSLLLPLAFFHYF